jgi:hypothetical protein
LKNWSSEELKREGNEVALLTKTELDWLNENIQLSYAYRRKIKSDIRKKIRILQELELPLLIGKGFVSLQSTGVTPNRNTVTAKFNTDTAEKSRDSYPSFHKLESLGRDLDPGPLPYQGNALPC